MIHFSTQPAPGHKLHQFSDGYLGFNPQKHFLFVLSISFYSSVKVPGALNNPCALNLALWEQYLFYVSVHVSKCFDLFLCV